MANPLNPILEAVQSSVGRACCYIATWILGAAAPKILERLTFRDIAGYRWEFAHYNSGTVGFLMFFHPLGAALLLLNSITLILFLRFRITFQVLAVPFFSTLIYVHLLSKNGIE